MKYRNVGQSGLKVSVLSLGAWLSYGHKGTEHDAIASVHRAVELGANFIDVADVYADGRAETIVGKSIKDMKRSDLVISTKAYWPMSENVNNRGLSRKHITESINASLKRLDMDYVDLFFCHSFDSETPLDETVRAIDDLVRQGKILYWGTSNWKASQLDTLLEVVKETGANRPIVEQPLYNLLDRSMEWELVPICLNEGLGIIPWSPLRGGWLGGKYRRGMEAPPAGTRVEMAEKRGWGETFHDYATEHTWNLLDTLYAIAIESSHTPAQVALRWLMQRPGVTAPIIAARTFAQYEDCMGAAGWALTEEQMARLTTASDKPLPYPYDHVTRELRS